MPNGARPMFKRSGMEVGWDLCRGMGVVGGKAGRSLVFGSIGEDGVPAGAG